MAKVTLKDAVDETKKETESLVAVEMTQAEKEQFIKYKQALDAIEKPKPVEKVEVTLRFQHRVNNNVYGPGPAVVTKNMGRNLFAQDEKKWASQIAATQENKKVVQMFLSGQRAVIREGEF
jgi:hypothetical protein